MAISEKVWPFGLDLASTAPQRVAAINIVVSGLKPFPKMRYLRRVDPSTRRGFLNGSEAGGSFRGWIPLGVLLLLISWCVEGVSSIPIRAFARLD